MRLIIQPDADLMAQWAANYIAAKINKAKPSAEKPFKLGLPTGRRP
jgi:glucosamine-6-phosphate deaminase